MTRNDQRKTVFLTGAAGGLGSSVCRLLAARDWRVFAADLEGEALQELGRIPNVTPLRLDVTDDASVAEALAFVSSSTDGLDAVVNFAGVLVVGSLVEVPVEAVRRLLDINVMGTIRVNRALFPMVLARKGRIVNVSSETGWQSAMPFNGAYAMSKHAIEAYSDALRRELVFLGVPVIKIQPGPFRTSMVAAIERAFARTAEESTYFRGLLTALGRATVREQAMARDPAILAEVVHTALTTPRPRPAYSVKPDLARALFGRLPARLADPLLARFLRWMS